MEKVFAGILAVILIFVAAQVNTLYASERQAVSNGSSITLDILLKKGLITQEEYSNAVNAIKQDKAENQKWEKHVDKHLTHAEDRPFLGGGLSIGGGITMVVQGTSGNDDNAASGKDVVDGNISVDLEISSSLTENSGFFLALEAGEGDGLEGDEIVSFWGVNADAGVSSTVDLTEAWYETGLFNDTAAFTIGKLNLTNYFDVNEIANDETTQFLSGGFVNNITIEFPDNSAGIRLTVSPIELVDLSLGAQSGDSDWEDILEKPFLIGEAEIKPKINDLQGNYRIYAWTNRTNHTELKDSTKDKEKGYGAGVSFDQQANDFLSLFGRIGYQSRKVYEFNIAWSGGLSLSGGLWGREHDSFALAFGQALLSGDNEDLLRAAGTNPGDEGRLEAYYSMAVNEHVTVSPDIQVVMNANGDKNFETVVIGGLRGQVTF